MKADAVEDCDWLAIDTELKLAPAEPWAVAVELPPLALVLAVICVSKVEVFAA